MYLYSRVSRNTCPAPLGAYIAVYPVGMQSFAGFSEH